MKMNPQTNWRDELREKGFGNQAVIIGAKRVELFDLIATIEARAREEERTKIDKPIREIIADWNQDDLESLQVWLNDYINEIYENNGLD